MYITLINLVIFKKDPNYVQCISSYFLFWTNRNACLSAIFAGFNNVIFTILHNGLQRWTESAEGYGTAYCILYTRNDVFAFTYKINN